MKRLMLLCLGALLLMGEAVGAAGPAKATILIEPDWNKNRQMTYQYSIVTQTYNGDTLNSETISKGLMVNRRVRKEKESFIFELEYRDTESNDPFLNNPAYQEMMEEAYKQKILYRVGKSGEFMGIENLEAIQKMMAKMIDVLFGEQKDETVLQMKAKMKEHMLNREFIENTITEEIKSLCDLYGLEMGVNQPVEFETELQNILEGPPYPARLAVELTDYNQGTGRCMGEIKVNPIPEKFAEITAKTVEKLIGKAVDPQLLQQMRLSMTHSFEYNAKQKLITKLNSVKDVTNLRDRKRREMILTLVEQ